MSKTKISEYSATANSNTDVASINIDEGCAPSGINNAIRAVMGHLKDFQTGTASDPLTVGGALTTSSTVTHSAGTANGVAYLNGSKVLTTGSALVFDGTNLGIGTSSPAKQLDLAANNTGITTGDPLNTLRFTDTDTTSAAGQPMGRIEWFSADTDTAGVKAYIQAQSVDGSPDGDIVFATNHVSGGGTTEKMRIQYDGNVGIGTSSPSAKLDIGSGTFRIKNATGDTSGLLIYQDTGDSSTFKNYYTGPFKWIQGSTQAMTLDASGNLGVGATTGFNALSGTETTLYVKNTAANVASLYLHGNRKLAIFSGGAGQLAFYDITGAKELGQFDSSGNLLVGTTSTSPTSGSVFIAGSATYQIMAHASGSSSGAAYHRFDYNSGAIGSITQTGTTAVLYNTTSDQRLKENIEDAESASALIDSLQVRQFDWKTDNSHQRYGFVAQELVTVAPEAVHQPVNPDDMMAVDYSKLVPMLVKEIQSLRQRLAAAGI